MKKKYTKVLMKMLLTIAVLGLAVLAMCLIIINIVEKEEKNIVNINDLPKEVDAIIVLGAGVKEDGTPSDILVDRLDTAIKIHNENVNGKILVSGDHGSDNYNEVKIMKEYILNNSDIDEDDIFMDHAGFSTYDSIYRACNIFKIKKAIIVTNEYHLKRALYIGEKMNIKVYGVSSDIRNYIGIDYYKFRERAAQIKDFFLVNVLKPESKYLGKEIPIDSSKGSETND